MGTVIVLVILSICVGITVWARYCKRGDTAPVLPEALSPTHKAFVHGNTCLREGKFAEATTNFRQALEFDPKHPHVRLCWLMRRAPDSKRWERDSSKALAGFLRALTIVFNANVESILELTNRVTSLAVSPKSNGSRRQATWRLPMSNLAMTSLL
jgi:hypothetical protein